MRVKGLLRSVPLQGLRVPWRGGRVFFYGLAIYILLRARLLT